MAFSCANRRGGALSEVNTNLQRIRELAVRAATAQLTLANDSIQAAKYPALEIDPRRRKPTSTERQVWPPIII
jgi:hypothetical protein